MNKAVALASIALLSVAAGGVITRAVRPLWQGGGDWGGLLLGNSTSTTIARGGCLLVLFTIAVNALRGTQYSPRTVNDLLRVAGVFDDGSALIHVDRAAAALKLTLGRRVRQDDRPTFAEIKGVVDEGLRKGLVVLHVDHNGDGRGDHFVLINGRAARGYTAADPAPGSLITLSLSLSGDVRWGDDVKHYTPVGAFALS